MLDLGNNKIAEVPVALVHYCKNLNTLNLVNNDLFSLPSLLGLHANLRNLQIEGNPMKQIRRPVIEKGSEAVLRYLHEKFVEGKDDVLE